MINDKPGKNRCNHGSNDDTFHETYLFTPISVLAEVLTHFAISTTWLAFMSNPNKRG